ncbi:hypothetical protein I302_108686 [Kwoniella bestiolae CBS 10118]|uniref:Uncharacterized protein n=1 Tax=Kwoniella bestiolae CBS 10118 TaxID=1296100 RepID=A0A1B9FTU4_9TREE|nr:hypothetical protein I302_07822 [Kwoniella bestiolae CBS 10118]OCF22178.1 hypothetical protein I302_07822 [Kwoniella bestiolae CBS 10118]
MNNLNTEGASTLMGEYQNTIRGYTDPLLLVKLEGVIDDDSIYEKSYNTMNFSKFLGDCTDRPSVIAKEGSDGVEYECSFGLSNTDGKEEYGGSIWNLVERSTITIPGSAFTIGQNR